MPLALIPARAGSKGLPGKNTKDLCGKPLLAYTVEAALQSGIFTRVVVSTEDEKIAAIARAHGAETPFVRPAELATDEAASMDVVVHAIEWLEKHEGYTPGSVTLLQPTSPLRDGSHIAEAHEAMCSSGAARLVSLKVAVDHHHWYFGLEEGRLSPVTGAFSTTLRRQDLPDVYAVNGAMYMSETAILLRERSFFGLDTYGYVMDRITSINIDEAMDFLLAQVVIENRRACPDKGIAI